MRRISLMAQKNAPLRLAFTEGELTVSAQTPDVGEASEPLPVPFAGEPFEIGFNPEFLRDGLESVGSGDVVAQAHQPAAPGPDRGRRRQRLPLPDHADPAQRLRTPCGRHPPARCATSAPTRAADVALGERPDGRPRRQRRGQDEPARGAVLRLHRALVPDERTSARSCASTRRPRAWRSHARDARRRARAERRLRSPARPSACASTARRSSGCSTSPARPLVSVFLPDRLELVKGPPALRRVAPRPARRRAVAGARRDAPRLRARRSPSATRCSARVRAGRAAAERRSARGTSSWPATALALRDDRAARGRAASAAPFADAAGELGLRGAASCATGRARSADTPEALAAELAERLRRPTSSAGSPATGRTATTSRLLRDGRELRVFGSQGEQRLALLALLLAERERPGRGARRRPAAAARRRDERARRRSRAAAARRAPAGRRAERGHDDRPRARPRARTSAGVVRLEVARRRGRARWPVARGGRGRHEAPAAAPARARRRRARRAPRAADASWPRSSASGRTRSGRSWPPRPSPPAERDGVVTVTCASAVWAQELDLMAPELVARLNAALGAARGARAAVRRDPRARHGPRGAAAPNGDVCGRFAGLSRRLQGQERPVGLL